MCKYIIINAKITKAWLLFPLKISNKGVLLRMIRSNIS